MPPMTKHGAFLDGERVRVDEPLYYLTMGGRLVALLQYGWEGRFATAHLLYVVEDCRSNGLGAILSALAIREAVRDGPFKYCGFITSLAARNIHYTLFEPSLPPISYEDFDPDDRTETNSVRNGEKAEAIARKYLERLLARL